MKRSSLHLLFTIGALGASSIVGGCASHAARETAACPVSVTVAPPKPPNDHVYRLDFALTNADAPSGSPATTFSINLREHGRGEVTLGKNVLLSAAQPPAGGSRRDVGLKVGASYMLVGAEQDLLLDVETELTAFEAPTSVRKMVVRAGALAAPGKVTKVMTVDDDHDHYALTVAATKIR
jgi:hypothetical protein